MSEANKIDYTGVITAARRGDEDAYEFLYNDSVRKCLASDEALLDLSALPTGDRPSYYKGRSYSRNIRLLAMGYKSKGC